LLTVSPEWIDQSILKDTSQGGSAWVTAAERKTPLSIVVLPPDKTAKSVKDALIDALTPMGDDVKTLTYV
jgi:IS30 family transposase